MAGCCSTNNNKKYELMKQINEYSFSMIDLLLYLDTHPEDSGAQEDFLNLLHARNDAVNEYSRIYGPLTIDGIKESADEEMWRWVYQPWPWENSKKGRC